MSRYELIGIATQLAYPLFVSLLLLLVGFALLVRRRVTAARRPLAAGIALLWIASLPVVGGSAVYSLERRFPPVAPDAAPKADAIVLLGGGVTPPHPPLFWTDVNDSADRVLHAARLWRAGRAPIVIASGGGGRYIGGPQTPAEAMADLLVELGVPRDAIVVETKSKNTYENAVDSKALLDARGAKSVLVATSAAHMLRSLAVFRSLGLDAEPAATDYTTDPIVWTKLQVWIPDAGSLRGTSAALKEYLGIFVYWLRGWIHADALGSVLRG